MEIIAQIFWKILQLKAVNICKSTNEYYQKIISKSGHKMTLYLAMIKPVVGRTQTNTFSAQLWLILTSEQFLFCEKFQKEFFWAMTKDQQNVQNNV